MVSRMDMIPQKSIKSAAEGMRGIAHELRLAVLCHLLNGPLCVQDIMKVTGASQSNLSQHLAKMRLMGLLETEKSGQHVYYRIVNLAYADLVLVLKRIYCPELCDLPGEK